MIQLNLLPDVKQKFIKTRRTRRLITLICLIIGATSVGIMGILFMTTDVWQTRKMNNLTEKIQESISELQSVEDLDKILTVQGQLKSLDDLHNKKAATTRLGTYLPQILPFGVDGSELEINFAEQTLRITGRADTLEVVNKFVDTLKFTDYIIFEIDENATTPEEARIDEEPVRAFSEVLLESHEIEEDDDPLTKDTTFTISAKFDPVIFATLIDNSRVKNVRLEVPKIITTRSELEQPGVFFETIEEDSSEQ